MSVSAMDQVGGAGRNTPPEVPEMPDVATKKDFERFHDNVTALFARFNRFFLWYQTALLVIVLLLLVLL